METLGVRKKEFHDYVSEVVESLKEEHDVKIVKKDNTPYYYITLSGKMALMYYVGKKGLTLAVREDFIKYLIKRYNKVQHVFGARILFKDLLSNNKVLIRTVILGAVLFEKELRR